jgi:L-ascorbate metabolism protein UlaG (beta-lactamase superfamily)
MIQEMGNKIHWLGHDAFRIDASKILYFDPYEIGQGPKADLIFISHEHFDHCSPEDVGKVQEEHTIIVTEKDAAKKLQGDLRILKPGDSLTIDGVIVRATPSYNPDKAFHPKANGWLGFIVEIDGVKIYHAGDTDYIPEMKTFDVDIALLPVSGTYVMTWEEAVQAAKAIKPKLAIPMHYGAIVGDDQDALQFKTALEPEIDVKVLQKE